MASRKFRFVSPGVFLKEIDNSQLPQQAENVGPVLIGRTRRGPAMKPYKIRSKEEFERVFGLTMPGNQGTDPWREGTDLQSESYLPYAARAYLSADIDSPVTVVRLAGINGPDAKADSAGETGWKAKNAFGLFFFDSGSSPQEKIELSAIFYGADDDFSVHLKGTSLSGSNSHTVAPGHAVRFDSNSNKLTLILSGSGTTKREVKFLPSEIRKDFNTNPVATNSQVLSPLASSLSSLYWLGETYDEVIRKFDTTSENKCAVVLEFASAMADFQSTKHELVAGRTGWIIGQNTDNNILNYDPANERKLFRLIALQEGARAGSDFVVGIEDLKIPREGAVDEFGTFSVVVKRIYSTGIAEVERFDNCNLNPNSNNFVAKMIGDQYVKWDKAEKRNKLYGTNPNISEYIRVDLDEDFPAQGVGNGVVPFGFLGPVRPQTKSIALSAGSGSFTASWIKADQSIHLHNNDGEGIQLTASWADFPLVNTASAADGYYFGASPYKMTYTGIGSGSTVTDEINPGYIDHVRRLSGLTGLTTDQDDGVADTNNSEYSFKFSLDEVVLEKTAASDLASNKDIEEESQVLRAVHVPGSRNNLVASTASLEIPSQASVAISLGDLNGNSITISDHNNVALVINFDSTTAAQSRAGTSVTLGIQGAGSQGELKNRLLAALQEASTANVVDITFEDITAAGAANSDAQEIKATQNQKGSAGNKPITLTNNNNFQLRILADSTFGGGKDAPSFSALHAANGSTGDKLRPLTEIVKGFHLPIVGGFDGTDITESNPFNNRVLDGATSETSYAYASIDRAIELIKDPEAIEHNLAVMPGITEPSLTTKLVRACESRGDSLAIIDLPDVYVPPSQQKYGEFSLRLKTTPERSAAALVKRQLNSSYGAAYYPWVKIRDEQFTRDVWAPPSVVALGIMAYTEKRAEVWFAPAGFNRGGLNQGNAGVPVLQASEQLTSKNRDTLYEANINPIASFVSEGLVVFGQKTLQSTQSALDRINVRRLLIFIKKEVSRISSQLLFEQNVGATWDRFKNQVVPFLASIRTRFGLTDYKVILDETTTTPDLVDRNILYAKILLKPARSIEFSAVDFVITRSGASFED